MLSRVRGINDSKGRYTGLAIVPKAAFYAWALSDTEYNRLYDNWVQNGYNVHLCPSVNRKDSTLGYLLPNMEWTTTIDNRISGLAGRAWRPYKNSSYGKEPT